MNRTLAAGYLLAGGGLVGYGVGVVAPYPGRAFSLTGIIVGATLIAIGNGEGRTT